LSSPALPFRGTAAPSLYEIGTRHGTDKAGQRELLHVYEEYLHPRRTDELVLLEIGVLEGGSLRMWREYLPRARIFGVDIDPAAADHAGDRITVLIGSQSDTHFLDLVVERTGRPDVVFDDGSHFARDQIMTLLQLWPHVTPGGIYVVEDIHTSYMPAYNMRWREPGTAVEFLKDLADDVNAAWHDRPVLLRDLHSVAFFQETCVLRKRRSAT